MRGLPFRIASVMLAVMIGISLAVVIYEVVAWRERDGMLRYQGRLILGRAIAVRQDIRAALDAAESLDTEACSAEDLEQLRLIALKSPYLMNLGRFIGGRIACDIVYGRAPAPIALGEPDFVGRAATRFWLDRPIYADGRLKGAAASRGSTIVFTRPRAYSEFQPALGDADIAIAHATGGFVFTRFGDGRPAQEADRSDDRGWFAHAYRECNEAQRLCVAVKAPAHLDPREIPVEIGFLLIGGGSTAGVFGFQLLRSRLQARRTPVRRLQQAIGSGGIAVLYQPLVRLGDRSMTGVEALARWPLADGTVVPPDIFIPLAERNGLLPALTRSVVTRALGDLAPMLRGDEPLYVSINIGVADLQDAALAALLVDECARHGIARSRVALEITERVTDDTARVESAVRALREAGFRVFLDDFGSGYSSLAYLATLPIDTIKLDKLFSRSVGTSLVGTLVLREICRMVETLDLTVVFEGVETEEQARALEKMAPGAIGQGWLFGRPMAAAELAAAGMPGPGGADIIPA